MVSGGGRRMPCKTMIGYWCTRPTLRTERYDSSWIRRVRPVTVILGMGRKKRYCTQGRQDSKQCMPGTEGVDRGYDEEK